MLTLLPHYGERVIRENDDDCRGLNDALALAFVMLNGLGNDTSRQWKQDALLVADSGMIKPTPAYEVFRHLAEYVVPGATVVGTTGGDAVAFKNPDVAR